ncbi:hypothetical protein F5887DRAFT_916836 [Amanita rubescens]|nr:hypothetical protein F5887DRAFT_916836 [Amanita rubescens]
MANYMIQSIQMRQYVTSGNEQPGDSVITAPSAPVGNCLYPPLAHYDPLSAAQTITTIKDSSNGLYINMVQGSGNLIWSSASYDWNVVRTSDGYYQLIPADGQDLYWTQDGSGVPDITLLSGSSIIGDIAYWTIN